MTPIEQQITDTWQIHNRICLLMIENISEEGFAVTLSKRGGRTVARQLAHMYNVRLMWAGGSPPKAPAGLTPFDKEAEPVKEELLRAFTASGEAVEKLIVKAIENDGRLKGMKRGVVPFLGYMISHEAHHRGNIFLTLKQTGHKISDALKWGVWDWDKL